MAELLPLKIHLFNLRIMYTLFNTNIKFNSGQAGCIDDESFLWPLQQHISYFVNDEMDNVIRIT